MNSLKIKKSTVGVFIIYFSLMDSVFPFADGSSMTSFFYWTKFLVALIVIGYSFIKKKPLAELREMRSITKLLRRVILFPWIVILAYSMLIWAIQKPGMQYITRGLSNYISIIMPLFLGFSLVEIFGKKAINITIIAVCLMTLTNYIVGVIANGPIFIIKLFDIFEKERSILKYKELHESAYISACLLIFYYIKKQYKIDRKWIILSAACFFFAWKRIGILAFLMGLMFYKLLMFVDKKSKKYSIIVCGSFGLILSMVYVAFSTSDGLTALLHEFGINMMGRDILYSYFRRFCDFSLSYLGHGIGFVSRQFNYATYDDLGYMYVLKQGLHNDLLCMYIEIGMLCFCVWLWYQLIYIPQTINKYYGIKASMGCFALTIFNFVTYTTSNTLRSFVFQTVYIILICLFCYSGRFENNDTRLI